MRSLRSSRPVLSATSGLGLAGTRRRGGAGGIGACWSLGPWRMKPPGPIERTMGSGALSGTGLSPGSRGAFAAGAGASLPSSSQGAAGAGAGAGFGAGAAASAFSRTFAFALGAGSFGFTGEGRDCRPSRWALPITALRETPPSSSAIKLAVLPWLQSSFRRSILSSVQDRDMQSSSAYGLRVTASATSDGAVSDQPSNWVQTAPGVPVIRNVNWGGLQTLYVKEVRRFFKVQLQTIWAPAVTTLLFLVIFTVALGRSGRMVMGAPFADFL